MVDDSWETRRRRRAGPSPSTRCRGRRCAARLPYHEPRLQGDVLRRRVRRLNMTDEDLQATLDHRLYGMAKRGKARVAVSAVGDAVRADDRDIAGDVEPAVPQSCHDAERRLVARADQG